MTLLEQSGNDFDQCALLVALLRAAGYTDTGYQFGLMQIPYDSSDHNDLHHWLGLSLVNSNWLTTSNYFDWLLPTRGFPNNINYFEAGDNNTIQFHRVWVTLSIGGTNYYLDPAFKVSEPVAGINLSSAMGLDTNALMSAAGGTASNDYVKSLNESALRTALQGLNTALLGTLQSNYPNASVQQILGGRQIVPWTNGLSQALLFTTNDYSGLYPIVSWVDEPNQESHVYGHGVSFAATNHLWFMPQLQGQRLSLTFDGNGVGQLWQDDMLVAQASTSGAISVITKV